VKIHEVGTPDDDNRNEPHVCDFRIAGFGFPANAALEISIAGHGGPNAGIGTFEATAAASELSADGDWAIDGPTLPDGMYKLEVENTTAPGGAKQKVFHVDCPDEPGAVGGDAGAPPAAPEVPAGPESPETPALPEVPAVPEAPGALDDGTTAAPAPPVVPAPPADVASTGASPLQAEVLSAAASRQPVATEVLGAQLSRAAAEPAARSALALTGTTVGGLALLGAAAIAIGTYLHRRSALRGA
jgi:hypothetical protein